jgi:hypothetical protein
MKADYRLAVSLMAIAFTAASARAGQIPIDISGLVNEPWTFADSSGCYILNASTYPTGSQNFGGVPFAIPTGPNNFGAGCAAANFGSGTVRLTIPVGVSGVTSVFILINTICSQPGPNAYLYIAFTGSAGATATQPLLGGVTVRDYNNDGGQNTINTSTVQAWTNGEGQRLDRQEYILPAAFAPSAGSVSPERLEPAPVAIRSGGGHVARDGLITGGVGPAQSSGAASADGMSFGIRTGPLAFARPQRRSD